MLDYDDITTIIDWDECKKTPRTALNPEQPHQRGTAQNPDIYFQVREAANKYYKAVPKIVEEEMKKVGKLTGRKYQLFDYIGVPDAEKDNCYDGIWCRSC